MKTPETTNERLALYIRMMRIDQEEFAKKIGTNRISLNHYLRGKSGSLRVLSNVTVAYPDINPKWLFSGEGPMLIATEHSEAPPPKFTYQIPSDEHSPTLQEELDLVALGIGSNLSPCETADYKQLYEQAQHTIHQLLIKLGEYRGKLELYQQFVSQIKR